MNAEIAISAADARELTDRIKVVLGTGWELVKEAYKSRAWSALGYESWDDYCTREFGTSQIRLPREERQEVVSSMREIGMSTRAIASATGTSAMQISRDLRGVTNVTPESEPAPVVGTDGKTYTPKPRPEPEKEPETPEWEYVGTIPQSRLSNLTPAPGFNPGDLDELNQPAPKPEAGPEPTKPQGVDKAGTHLTDVADQIATTLELLETMNYTNITNANKEKALALLEQATRSLTNIKKQLR